MNEVIIQEYEAKINEKTNEMVNFQFESGSEDPKTPLQGLSELERSDLMQELNSERMIREKLQSENEALENAMAKTRLQYESRVAALATENEQLTNKISELESERIDQEEKLQNAVNELKAREVELEELRKIAASETPLAERVDKVKKVKDSFLDFEATSSIYKDPGIRKPEGEIDFEKT